MSITFVSVTICTCNHIGEDHSPHEPRVCKHIDCYCYQFKAKNQFEDQLNHIDKYVLQFEKWYDRLLWLCQNISFILGFSNTRIVFWYWKYVYPKWDPETEFLTEEIRKAIEGDAKPEAITRGFREVKELHPEMKKGFQNLVRWKSYNEAGYREAAVAMKQ
ncbi:MAG: hypothetical protein IIA83_09595 [Thaumarchaeota archaeon]|nr:hypothetical protein [Nitrososphaerota archaeon]